MYATNPRSPIIAKTTTRMVNITGLTRRGGSHWFHVRPPDSFTGTDHSSEFLTDSTDERCLETKPTAVLEKLLISRQVSPVTSTAKNLALRVGNNLLEYKQWSRQDFQARDDCCIQALNFEIQCDASILA